jgi:hypothetical protein
VVHKGIYGLPQAGRLAQDQLTAHLALHGYRPAPNTPALFRHNTRPISFVLVVDDFGIKYKTKEDAEHLLATSSLRAIKVDWSGSKYVGFTVQYDKTARTIRLSMPDYIPNALRRFGIPSKGVNSPGAYVPFHRSSAPQLVTVDDTPRISAPRAKRIQEIVGVLMYLANALDATLLTRTLKIGSLQSRPTEAAAELLLQYCH